MPTMVNGLPAHVLLVHVVIAAVPLAAILLVLHATWPSARRRLGAVTPVVALVALVIVPVTTHAGQWLRSHLTVGGPVADRVARHAQLGTTLLPLVVLLFLAAVAVWQLGRRYEFGLAAGAPAVGARTQEAGALVRTALPGWASAVVAVVAVVIAVVTVVQLYRIGDSGAKAVWTGIVPSR